MVIRTRYHPNMAMSDDKSDESGMDPDPTIDLPAEDRVGSTPPGLNMGAGDTIGSFKIIQMLGEGGFGMAGPESASCRLLFFSGSHPPAT